MGELIISDIISTSSVFVPEIPSSSILPGDTTLVPVHFTPTEMEDYIDTITIFSNDPVDPEIQIVLTGSGFFQIIGTIPEQHQLLGHPKTGMRGLSPRT